MPHQQVDRSRTWRLTLRILALSVAASFMPSILHMAVRGRVIPLHDFAASFGPNLLISLSIAGLANLALERWARYIATRQFPLNVIALVGLLIAIAAAGLLLAFVIMAAIGIVSWNFWTQYFGALRIACVITLIIGVTMYIYETYKHRLEASGRELEARRQEAERAHQTAVQARLASLESRIHPHFLFNTLNSITALIREDPPRAEQLVERLAALLRFSLDSNQKSLTTLGRELKIVVDYLEIEKARFGDRLTYTIDIPEALRESEVPPMSIQTLVENSVKFAVSPRREGGRIEVSARSSGGELEILVADDGPGFTETGFAEGHGLDTLQSRIAAQFGDRGRLTVARRDGRTQVSVHLPVTGARS
jgi:two-component system sensor histidine kinase AlgZ